MILQVCIATIACISWPLIFALYRKDAIARWFTLHFRTARSKATASPLPPLNLPLRYDEIIKDISKNNGEKSSLDLQAAAPSKKHPNPPAGAPDESQS